MADNKESKSKPAAKKKQAPKPAPRPDVLIVIGAKDKVKAEPGIQVWHLDGDEVTESGDRRAVASLTSQDLFALGWVRRKH
jgi:hypothetical protein|tara:strand:+ start:440 stop:682 length:243 start_codon:yes stop_codon:yes gene_type:complete